MNDIEKQIDQRVRAFAQELNALIRAAALEAVSEALSGGRPARGARALPRSKGVDGRSAKRTEDEIAAIGDRVEKFVASNPGLGIEKIARGLDTVTSELTLPVTKLIAQKRLRREGDRRASKYFVTGAGKTSKKRAKRSA